MNELTTRNSNYELFNSSALKKMMESAEMFSKSSLVPQQFRNNPADLVIVWQYGIEIGLSPMIAMREVYVVNGTPTLSGKMILSALRKSKIVKITIEDLTPDKSFIGCRVTMERNDDGFKFSVEWDTNRAATTGLLRKDNWQKHPQEMCRWRAIAECARIVAPEVIMNMYLSDEIEGEYSVSETDAMKENAIEISKINEANREFDKCPPTDENVIIIDEDGETSIANAKWEIPIGAYKGRTLESIPYVELAKYFQKIKNLMNGADANNSKHSESMRLIHDNVDIYLKAYNEIK